VSGWACYAVVSTGSAPGSAPVSQTEDSTGAAALAPEHALAPGFYDRPAPEVARTLLGAILVSTLKGETVAGRIVETEAYGDESDPASHASFRRSGLVRAMWGAPGTLYVYAAYGMYPCFNAVTGAHGTASAVLVRALELIQPAAPSNFASGPGRAGRVLGLATTLNGHDLGRAPLWIQPAAAPGRVVTAARVGITRGLDRHWRFALAGHPAVSRPRPW
jgi:DNA-3-methyladenine glycosylase